MEKTALLTHEKHFDPADTVFAFLMLVCGFLYWNLIDRLYYGAGTALFAVYIFAVSLVYLKKSGIKQNSGSLITLTAAGLYAAQFALFDNRPLGALNLFLLSLLYIYWICLATGRRLDVKLSAYLIGDTVKQGLSIPLHNFGCCAAGMTRYLKGKKFKTALPALIGILLSLPLIAVVISLLASADSAFEHFIKSVFKSFSFDKAITYIIQFIIGIPVAFYLFGLVYGNVKGRHTDKITIESADAAAKGIRIAPGSAVCSILAVFNAIYLTFFTVQAAYLFSAFSGRLPEAFSHSEYARRGFFELCAVAGINLGLLTVSNLTMRRDAKKSANILRVETLLISAFTILLIITALSKMAMYVNAYGLTRLRVYTSWFMLLLCFVFAVIIVRQFTKFNSSKLIIIGAAAMFMLLSFGNVDFLIAKYNIGRLEAGTLESLDVDTLRELSDAAVPAIYEMYLRTDEKDHDLREQLASAILDGAVYSKDTRVKEFNLQSFKADRIRELVALEYPRGALAGLTARLN